MNNIVADEWSYVEWAFTAEKTSNDEMVFLLWTAAQVDQ
jgi:hypothetical protein